MSREEILTRLLSFGAISVIHAIQDVEAGRVRRVAVPQIPGGPTFAREVVSYLRAQGAEVEFSPGYRDIQRPHLRVS